MADLVISAANVSPSAGATLITGTAGEPIAAGQVVAVSTADGLLYLADVSTGTIAAAAGIAVNSAPRAGQPVTYAAAGDVDVGTVTSAGAVYVVGQAVGGISPEADAGTGDYVSIVGVGRDANTITVTPVSTGVTHA